MERVTAVDAERTREPDFGIPARFWKPVAAALAAAVTLAAMAWSLDVPRMMGVSYYPQQFLAVILALTLPLAFMLYRPDREKRTD